MMDAFNLLLSPEGAKYDSTGCSPVKINEKPIKP